MIWTQVFEKAFLYRGLYGSDEIHLTPPETESTTLFDSPEAREAMYGSAMPSFKLHLPRGSGPAVLRKMGFSSYTYALSDGLRTDTGVHYDTVPELGGS